MPVLTSQATTFRTSRYTYRAFLSYLPQTIVLQALVNGTPTFPATSITVDNVTTGTVAGVVEGQTIAILDGSGNLRGRLRVANGGGSGSVIQVNEVSAGTVNITDNDTVIVYDEFRIWDKLVSATAALNKDSRIAYTDQGSNPPPVANAGGLWAGFLDSGQTYATVTFDASVSFVMDPDSGGTRTYLWNVDDGTITVGTTTTSAITVRFPAGFRHVQLTVTDAGNSKSTVRWIPVWVHEDDASGSDYPYSVLVESRDYTESDGWTCQFQLPVGSEADLDNLPDGALVVLWEDQRYGTTQANYGSNVSNRSHIKFVGFLDRDQITIDADDDTVTFTAISPLGVLAQTPALPQLTVQDSAPANWQELKTNSVHRTLWYLWYWHTTALVYFDFILPSSGDLTFTRLATTVTSNQLEQFRDIASSLGRVVTCDWLGRLIVDFDPQLLDSTDRNSRTTAYNLTTADIVEIEWEREHRWSSKTVVGEGITDGTTSSSNAPVYSLAPGTAPASLGAGTDTLDRQIVDNQTDLNERTGLHFAKINSLYYGRKVPRGLRLRLRAGYDVFDPALQEYVTLTLPATTNKRGVAFTSSTRWLVVGANVAYDPETGTKEVSYTLNHETFGANGTTDTRPTPEENGLPGFTLPDLSFPGFDLGLTPIGDPTFAGNSTIALLHSNGVSITTNFNTPSSAGGPNWTTYSAATLGIGGTIYDWVIDPFNPANAWCVTSTQIGYLTGVFTTRSYAVQHTFVNSNAINRQIEVSRGVSGLVSVASEYNSAAGYTGQRCITSDDGGATWGSEVLLSSTYNTTFNVLPGLYVGRTGNIYTSASSAATSTPNPFTGRKSTDGGATFATVTNPLIAGYALASCLHFPWHNNASESLVYYGSIQDSAPDIPKMYRANGSTRTDITPTDASARPYGPRLARSIHTPDNNQARVAVNGTHQSGATRELAIFISDDYGVNWLQITSPLSFLSTYVAVNVSDNGLLYAWGDNRIAVASWNDLLAGGALDSRVGDLTGSPTVRNIMGG